jgi:hypothetical protein
VSAGLGEVVLTALDLGSDVLGEAVELAVALHPVVLRFCTEHAGGSPAEAHVAGCPALHVPRVGLDDVDGGLQSYLELSR